MGALPSRSEAEPEIQVRCQKVNFNVKQAIPVHYCRIYLVHDCIEVISVSTSQRFHASKHQVAPSASQDPNQENLWTPIPVAVANMAARSVSPSAAEKKPGGPGYPPVVSSNQVSKVTEPGHAENPAKPAHPSSLPIVQTMQWKLKLAQKTWRHRCPSPP